MLKKQQSEKEEKLRKEKHKTFLIHILKSEEKKQTLK